MRLRSLRLLLPLLVAGCHRLAIDAPGLGPRPIEAQPVPSPESAASEPDAPATPALAAKLVAILADARATHARFEADRRAGAAAVARGRTAPEGSEAWVAGQQALSGLAAQAGALREQAAAIDALRIDPAYAAAADRAAIDAAAAEIETLSAAERAAIAG
jgi:hypothetical protein